MVQCDAGSSDQMVDTDCGVHLMVEDATVETSYGTSIKVKFSVLAATDPGQVGKSITEFFQCEGEKAVNKLYNLAEAVGIITAEQRKVAVDQSVGLDIDETLFKGRQLCGQIKMETKMRKNPVTGAYEPDPENPGPYPRLGFRTFGVQDKKAKDIPKDQQFLVVAASPQGPVSRPLNPAPQQPPPQQQPPAGSTGGMPGMGW